MTDGAEVWGGSCIKKQSSFVLPRHRIGEELSGPALRGFQSADGRGQKSTYEGKDRNSGGQRHVLFGQYAVEIFQPILKIRYHMKIRISGFSWKIWRHRVCFFLDGSWLELRNGCLLLVGCEFYLPYAEPRLASPFALPAQPCWHLSRRLQVQAWPNQMWRHDRQTPRASLPLTDSHTCWFSGFPSPGCYPKHRLFCKISACTALKIIRCGSI